MLLRAESKQKQSENAFYQAQPFVFIDAMNNFMLPIYSYRIECTNKIIFVRKHIQYLQCKNRLRVEDPI